MPSLTRRLFLVSLNCAPWAFSKSWDAPAFPSWSSDFIDKLLTDSPWAAPSTVRVDLDAIQRFPERKVERIVVPSSSFQQIELPSGIGLPRTGSGVPGVGWPRRAPTSGSRTPPTSSPGTGSASDAGTKAEIFLTTRWASALPIRRAQALQRFGRDGLKIRQAADALDTTPAEYVIEIAGFPTTMIRQGAARFASELKESACLRVAGRQRVAATSSEVPEHGMHLMATLSFPRFHDLDIQNGYIELSVTARGISLRERFKLKYMTYGGNLEL